MIKFFFAVENSNYFMIHTSALLAAEIEIDCYQKPVFFWNTVLCVFNGNDVRLKLHQWIEMNHTLF